MPESSLGDRLRGLFASQEELEARELREQATDAGAQSLASCVPRSRVTLRGTVTSVTSDADNGWLEAELDDGSGTVRLMYLAMVTVITMKPQPWSSCDASATHTLSVSARISQRAVSDAAEINSSLPTPILLNSLSLKRRKGVSLVADRK